MLTKFLLDRDVSYYQTLLNFLRVDALAFVQTTAQTAFSMTASEWLLFLIWSLVYAFIGFHLFLIFFPPFGAVVFYWPMALYHRLTAKPLTKTKRKINLRKVKATPEQLAEFETDNVFISEMTRLGDRHAHIFDFCVMKYVGESVPLIQKQEHQHAMQNIKTFSEYNKTDEMQRWNWFLALKDWACLRSTEKFGVAMGLHIEATSPIAIYTIVKYCQEQTSAMLTYHALEECEHAAVTVHNLRKKTNLLYIWLTGIFKTVTDSMMLLFLPFAVIIGNPILILNPFKMFFDWCCYLHMMMGIFKNIEDARAQVWHPQPLEPARYEKFTKEMEEFFLKRGLDFEIIEQAEYEIDIVESKKCA